MNLNNNFLCTINTFHFSFSLIQIFLRGPSLNRYSLSNFSMKASSELLFSIFEGYQCNGLMKSDSEIEI